MADPTPDAAPTPDDRAPGRLLGRARALSLRARLLGLLLALLLASLAITGYGVQRMLHGYLLHEIDEQLVATAHNASTDLGFLNALISERRRFPSPYVVSISVDGQPETRTVSGFTVNPEMRQPSFPALGSAEAAGLVDQARAVRADDGSLWRASSFPVTLTDGGHGSVTILQSLDRLDGQVLRVRLLTILIGTAVAAACAVLGWVAIRRAFAPLAEVEDTAAAIAAGDLSRRIPERPASTEVGRLTASLNGMLTQIEGAFRAREASEARTRRFAADASHELRTPLASIRGFAELYRQGAVPDDEVPRTMRRIEDEAKRMGGLVEDLLLLARLDAERPTRADPVDLLVLAGDAVHDIRGLDAARTVQLVGLGDAGGPVSALVLGDEDRLRQVVANLVGNAVRHTPPGSPIEVAVGLVPVIPGLPAAGGRAVLQVVDHGPGLSPEQAERVFERFYRADASRQRGTGGSGLGLSIVLAVVSAHGGRVGTAPTPGGGATFTVELPAVTASSGSASSGTTQPGTAAPAPDRGPSRPTGNLSSPPRVK